jgi:hypothetical protein
LTYRVSGGRSRSSLRPSEEIARRLSFGSHSERTCAIPGCRRLAQRSAGKGFSHTHCRYHVQFKNRHGSYSKGTYSAATLAPYRKAVRRFLAAHPPQRQGGLSGVFMVCLSANYSSVLDARSRSPAVKASAVLARLRDSDVPHMRVLEAYLAVCTAVADDPIRPGGDPDEYRRVQAAKAVHRLASGERKDYGDYGSYHRYSRSSGLMLRHLGVQLDDACGKLADWSVPRIIAEMHEANEQRPSVSAASASA